MSKDLSILLGNPKPGMTLDELATELNQIAGIREGARLAFCKRLAVVYLMIVGHPPRQGCTEGGLVKKFNEWCAKKIKSGTGKPYTIQAIRQYLRVGFAKNPEKYIRQVDIERNRLRNERVSIARAVTDAVATEAPPKVIPITKLKQQGLPTDVATEVNRLMTAWEQASSQARSQFMYLVTGKRIAA